jgi:hypothetical protein
MSRKKSGSKSPTETESLVRGATRARHGGRIDERLVNKAGLLKTKRRLNADYRSGPVVRKTDAAPAINPKSPAAPIAAPRDSSDLHSRAVDAIEHLSRHGDWRKITQLMEALRGDPRRGKLKRWFEQFGVFSAATPLTFRPRRPLSDSQVAIAALQPFF